MDSQNNGMKAKFNIVYFCGLIISALNYSKILEFADVDLKMYFLLKHGILTSRCPQIQRLKL